MGEGDLMHTLFPKGCTILAVSVLCLAVKIVDERLQAVKKDIEYRGRGILQNSACICTRVRAYHSILLPANEDLILISLDPGQGIRPDIPPHPQSLILTLPPAFSFDRLHSWKSAFSQLILVLVLPKPNSGMDDVMLSDRKAGEVVAGVVKVGSSARQDKRSG